MVRCGIPFFSAIEAHRNLGIQNILPEALQDFCINAAACTIILINTR